MEGNAVLIQKIKHLGVALIVTTFLGLQTGAILIALKLLFDVVAIAADRVKKQEEGIELGDPPWPIGISFYFALFLLVAALLKEPGVLTLPLGLWLSFIGWSATVEDENDAETT